MKRKYMQSEVDWSLSDEMVHSEGSVLTADGS